MSRKRPTTREVFGTALPVSSQQAGMERAFFSRVQLPNGTLKTTNANRLDDLNNIALRHLDGISMRPLKIMDVAVSSGVSTLEWHKQLSDAGVVCEVTATDQTIYTSLLTLSPAMAILIDRNRNILHMDVIGQGIPPGGNGLQGLFLVGLRTVFQGIFGIARAVDSSLPPIKGTVREPAKGKLLKCEPITLLTKELPSNQAIRIVEDDLLRCTQPDFLEAFHVIRAANILNRGYFSEPDLLEMVVRLRGRLKKQGVLIVCRTLPDDTNHATIFGLTNSSRFCVLERLGRGAEIEDLVTSI